MSGESLAVGIAGAGAIACASACLLHLRGHRPALWSPSGAGTEGLSEATPLQAQGAEEATFCPEIAPSAEALAQADVLMLALPAYGFETVINALVPHIREGQPVIISSHISLAALYLNRKLQKRGVRAPIIAWGTTIATGRRPEHRIVRVNTVRTQVDLCALPESYGDEALLLCERLFGERFRLRDGLLAISLSNLNPQNHMGIALGNITRMEHGESWSQGGNVTPNVGRLLEALDLERLAIARAVGVEVRTIFEHFHLSFHVPIASISEMNQQMHEAGNGGYGPTTADSRYVTEDVPYGLALTEQLGRLTACPTPLHSAGIDIFSAMYGRDFRAENKLLPALGLNTMSLKTLQTLTRDGYR